MIETRQQQTTPSVYFNFDYSNQKTNEADLHKQYVPYEYSFSTNKMYDSNTKDVQFPDQAQCEFATPPSYLRNNICKNLLQANSNTQDRHALISNSRRGQVQSRLQNVTVKLNTQQFFDDFDKNFVVNFGQTPIKNQTVTEFRKTFQSCPGGPTIKDSISSKIDSHISQPLARRNSIEPIDHQNQQQISGSSPQLLNKLSESQKNKQDPHPQKQNKPPNEKTKPQPKVNCEIRKRIMLKNNEKISSEIQKRRNISANRIINQENLLVITSSNWDNWTDLPRNKKGPIQANSQPITRADKTLKKVESNIFTTRQMFKQTLRSTTLDSWKKKFTLHKNELDLRHKNRRQNIFQKPFSLIR